MDTKDLWGWLAPIIVWCGDHYSAVFAVTLFVLQIIYQSIRIKRVCTDKYIRIEDD